MHKLSKKILVWEIVSALFVIFVGSALHFAFAWSGYNIIVGAFSAVNESTWEHTKLAFFPILIFSLFQYPFVKKEFTNYFTVKTKELYAAVLLIIIIFYSYTGILGTHYLWADILTFMVAVILAKYIAYRFLFNQTKENKIIPILFIALLGIFFVYATFYPPKIQLFKDTPTGTYGIVNKTTGSAACTMEAKICPDGSAVGRTGSDCEFAPCPTNPAETPKPTTPTEENVGGNSSVLPPEYLSQMESCTNDGGSVEKRTKDMGSWTAISSWQCVCPAGKTSFGTEKLACNTWFTLIQDTVACTQEAKLCPDGSYVSRTGPNCEFAACPTSVCSCPAEYIQEGDACNPECYYSTPQCLAPSFHCQ